jgi:multiple sugar transport system permease protein
MAIFALYVLIPFYWLVIASTKSNGGIIDTFGLLPTARPSPFSNLRSLFSYDNGIFLRWSLNSFVYTAVAGALATLLSLMAGYALYVYRFMGRRFILFSLVAATAVPGATLAFPLYFLIAKMGLANTLLGLFLPLLVAPFGVFLMWLYLSSTDCRRIVQAARVDGASEFRIFRSIVVPIASPAVVTVFLLVIVAIWNNYILPVLVITNPNLQPLTVGLAMWAAAGAAGAGASRQLLYTLVVTGSIVFITPIVALFLVLQRYWRNGLSLGSTVG